jgi:UTP--glucose-1-phosphate uridylyltransferase
LIQYAAEEAVAAGADVLIFITGRNKNSIPDHFDHAYELETELDLRGKQEQLKLVQDIVPDSVSCVYIRQAKALGLGHAVLCAAPVVGNEPFFVILADDLIGGAKPALVQMNAVFQEQGGSIIGVDEVPKDETHRYGIVKPKAAGERLHRVTDIVEKPKPADAPSNLGVVGRYILTPRIFELLRKTTKGAGGEIQLTDAIGALIDEEPVFAYAFEGTRYDCGDKLGYLKATVEYGLRHPQLGAEFRDYLADFASADPHELNPDV